MTRKDYVKLADVMAKQRRRVNAISEPSLRCSHETFLESMLADLCETLRFDNPRLDESRFIKHIVKHSK